MSQEWVFTCYCDKCHAGQHFEGETAMECSRQAAEEGWTKIGNIILCQRCKDRS